jgi:hypothetical protein
MVNKLSYGQNLFLESSVCRQGYLLKHLLFKDFVTGIGFWCEISLMIALIIKKDNQVELNEERDNGAHRSRTG